MAAVLVLLLIAAVAAGIWGFTRLRSADAELDSRADVARVAEQFTIAVNNYDTASADEYKSKVSDLLSTKFRADFDKAMQDIVTQIQGTKMSSQGKVLASGVATLDDDSARVLVVADADVTTAFDKQGLQRHFRWEVSLVKVDGKWLVDDFRPVA
jgi:Mce-associated membrane protein